MSDLILIWMLIVIPVTGTVPIDTLKQLCISDINRKAVVQRIVISDEETDKHYLALKVKCFRIPGKKA